MTHRQSPRPFATAAGLAGATAGLGVVFTLVGGIALAIGNGPGALLVGLAVTAPQRRHDRRPTPHRTPPHLTPSQEG